MRSNRCFALSHFLINAKTETTLNEVNSVLDPNAEFRNGFVPAVKGLELLGFRTLVALLSGSALDCAPTALKENLRNNELHQRPRGHDPAMKKSSNIKSIVFVIEDDASVAGGSEGAFRVGRTSG